MSEFKRGDRVEVRKPEGWYAGLLICFCADPTEVYVSLDGYGQTNTRVGIDGIRAPRKTIKVMMQDWVATVKDIDPALNFVSRHRDVNLPDSQWKKSGEPYEKEFEL